ncbi:putative zinc finger protein [Hydrogenispora ethanolica]|jgi:anti-sigma factor RsiW|uniref:Anti-sigma-W factor RsiW n=1 Tax=Hydrogenispora ethanolica TaxID=1082276 RepID=A0A4V2QDB5_HYDET|nr:zf-HC2 domain-containing protein [Hydrogenispora ethanolica]TCL62977.1 putative zinc finger protein [Hydrogenispora ethanolica]
MNCHYVQSLISAFIDRELDADEKRELRRHLISCSECNVEYQDIQKIKTCLENLIPESYDFDPMIALRSRLVSEANEFIPTSLHLLWWGRLGLVAAGLLLFFLSTAALFPSEPNSARIAQRRHSSSLVSPVSYDQNISIDHSVNIYQASSILP